MHLNVLHGTCPCFNSSRPASYNGRCWNISLWFSKSDKFAIWNDISVVKKIKFVHLIEFIENVLPGSTVLDFKAVIDQDIHVISDILDLYVYM